ncbi:unnamed protein product [Scytosiphon promiscuus]
MSTDAGVSDPTSDATTTADTSSAEALGMSRKARRARRFRSTIDCANVTIDSPDFARCSTELGAGRTVLAGDPVNVAHNTAFVNDSFTPQGAQAFPFTSSNASERTREGDTVPKDVRRVRQTFWKHRNKIEPIRV